MKVGHKHAGRLCTRSAGLITISSLIFSCSGSSSATSGNTGPETDDVVVTVSNNTLARLRVHAKYGESEPMLLGEVSTNRTRAFTMPWKEDYLRIGVRRADATVTEPRWSNNSITVSPRDSLEFTLTANARRTAEVSFRKAGTRGGL